MATKTAEKKNRYRVILLDRAKKRPSAFASLHPEVVSSLTELRYSLAHASADTFWISYTNVLTEALVKQMSASQRSTGWGLFIHSIDVGTIPALTSFFRRIAFTTDGGFIPEDELVEVLQAENSSDLFIGGCVNRETKTITFWRGDLKPLTVPCSSFEVSGDGTQPDFDQLAVVDYGQTVQLGEYEAAVDAILYENDSEYRRRISKKRLQQEQSFGASLRRLRKQRGLKREDFEPGISAKTIARIEQGRVSSIHKKTLEELADLLSVAPEEIETF
ncbi:MAG: hypothetical protein RI963_2259 [Planctomycetota bacterium]|jgi:DNA-binding Xre family transcriptional regulator